MLLTHRQLSTEKHLLVSAMSQVASAHHGLCQGRGDYHSPLMKTDSIQLMKEGVALAKQTWELFSSELPWPAQDFHKIFTHQVSQVHYEKVFQELNMDPRKGRQDCILFGNTGSVAALLSLALAEEEKDLRSGDKIALLGIGSGLNAVMLGIQW